MRLFFLTFFDIIYIIQHSEVLKLSNTNSPFEKYKAKQTSDEKSMSHNSNELLRAGNNEELWKKLFFISLTILLVVSIILIFLLQSLETTKLKQ